MSRNDKTAESEISSERTRDYIHYINISRGIETDPAIAERLKRTHFSFDQSEFSKLLQASKELRAVFYNKSIAVHLHTDGTTGHVSADLPSKTATGIQVMPNVGLEPAAGKGIAATSAEFVSLPRSSHPSKIVTVSIPIPQEQYESLAELTAKRMKNPGVSYQVTSLGHNNYNCIHYMHKHLQEAGISSGLNNLFSHEQLQQLTWAPILIPHIRNYSDEFKLQQFRIGLSASDATSKNEANMIAAKQRELTQQYEFSRQQQLNRGVSEFLQRAKMASPSQSAVPESRAKQVYTHLLHEMRDAGLNPARSEPPKNAALPVLSASKYAYESHAVSAPTTYPQALQRFSQSAAAVSSAPATSSYPQALQRSFNAAFGRDAFGYDSFGRDRFGFTRFSNTVISSFRAPSCLSTSYTSCLSRSSSSYSWQSSRSSIVWDTYMTYVRPPRFTSSFESMYGISEYKFANMGFVGRLYFLRNQLDVTGLLSSYNSSVGYGACRGMGLYEIGGVATEAGILEGLKNSNMHALLDEMIFAIQTQDKKIPCTHLQLQQLLRELHQAIFVDETNPFFSLHFNNSSYMYPVMHPVFHNTLTGEIIATLDYWMKGFLNGGTFPLDFIRQWHKTTNMEKSLLKANLIDLKAYCKQQGIEYISLREMMHEAGLAGPDFDMSDDAGSPYKTKFKTSFRIIGYVKSVQGADGVLFFEPTFRVEHTLEPMPDYKITLDNYFQEHGEYPEDYQKLQMIYERAKNQIANVMPRLPLFRDYFEMLKIIAQICYYFTTLKSMGKKPILPLIENLSAIETPKSYPPVPVRQYNYPKIKLSIKTIVDYFQAKVGANQPNLLDRAMLRMSETMQTDWDEQIQREIKDMIAQSIRQQLPIEAQSTAIDERKILIVLKAFHQNMVKAVQAQLHFQSEKDDSDGFLITVKKIELTIGKKSLFETCQSKPTLREKIDFLIQSINEYEAAQLCLPLPAMPKEVIDNIRGQFEQIKNKLRASAAAARSHYQSQINNIPNELAAAESSMRNEVEQDARRQIRNSSCGITEAGIDLKIRQIRSQIDSVIAQNAANIREQGDRIRSQLNSALSSTYTEESSKLAALDQDCTNFIRDAFKKAMQNCRDVVQKSAEETKYLSRAMKKNSDYDKTLLETYPVSMLDFVDNNKIVGGCGLSLSKLMLQPMSANQRQAISFSHLTPGFPAENFVQSNNHWVFKIKIEDQTLEFDPSALIPLQDISIEESRKLLDEHPDFIHMQDHNGVMPIHIAAMTGNTEGLSELAKRGADINRVLPNGLTPLRMALQNHHEDAAIALLSMPAINISVQIDNGENPLHCAIEQELQKAALLFIQKGADLSQPRHADGLSAFHLAIQKGKMDLVKAMLATKRVNIQSQTTNGQTALHIAAQNGNQEMVAFLLSQGATSIEDKQKKLPLSYAIAEMHEGVAIDLVNATTTQLNELLLLAAKKHLFSVCDSLIAKGASVNYALSESDPRDYLYYLVKYGQNLRLKQLIELKKGDLKKTYYRHSVSAIAVKFGRMDSAELLIRNGVALSAQLESQWIQKAIINDDIAIVRRGLIRQENIDPILLYLAVENNSNRCVSLLLPRFTEASLQNVKPQTHIMDAAIRCGEIAMVEKMLPYCSDVNVSINAANQSPLMLATALGGKKIIEKLLQTGADILKKLNHKSALHEAVLNDDIELLKFFEAKIPVSEWPNDLSDFASQHKKQKSKQWLISKGIALTHVVPEPDSQLYPEREAFLGMMLQLTDAVHRFLQMRIKVNERETVSLLRAGIDNEDFRVIDLFMKHSFAHDARFDQGETKLHLAVRLNNADYLTACLAHIPVDSAADNGVTPLMLASALGRARMTEILLEHGANPDRKNTLQQNALHMAIIEKHEEVAMQLIAVSRVINAADREGDTPLMCAAISDLPKVLKTLLKRGAKWDMRSEKGLAAIHYAALAGFVKCVFVHDKNFVKM